MVRLMTGSARSDDAPLRLALTPGLGRRSVGRLLEKFDTPRAAMDASARKWREEAGVSAALHRAAGSEAVKVAAQEVRSRCHEAGIEIVPLGSSRYPPELATIYDPPLVLYALGKLPEPNEFRMAVAIVGTRKASSQGLSFAYRLGSELARAGAPIVSGLAIGIDAEAHRGALAAGGRCVAVLPGGLDAIHPPGNSELGQRLLERGCLLSEWPPGTPLQKGLFVGRNRIISGLVPIVVIVEAGSRSGALRTAEFALEQGRTIFAMPGRPGDPRMKGSLALLRDGASVVVEPEDVALALGLGRAGPHPQLRRPAELGTAGELLASGNATFDDLLEACGLSPSQLLALLGRLELSGQVRRNGDGSYRLQAG